MRNLCAEMSRFGVSTMDIQKLIGCTDKTARSKINGNSEFSVSEALNIRDKFFPGLRIEYLFADDTKKTHPPRAEASVMDER